MYATTHVIIPLIIIDLIRDYVFKHKHRRIIPRKYIFFVGIGGILPDIDIAIGYLLKLLSVDIPTWLHHGRITHSIIWPILLLIIAGFLWEGTKFSKGASKKEHHHWFLILTLVAVGILSHIFLDGLAGNTTPYYPLSQAVAFGAQRVHQLGMVSLDAIILLVWLFHEEWRHNIKKFF